LKKSNLYVGIFYLLIGIAFLLIALFYEKSFEGLLWGFGGAGISCGSASIIKYLYWSRSDKAELYKQKLENERIEMNDERKIMLRDKSGRITYCIMLGVYTVLLFILSILTSFSIVEVSKYVLIGLSLLIIFQFTCGIIVFQYLNKRL